MIRDILASMACAAALYCMPWIWGFFGGAMQ